MRLLRETLAFQGSTNNLANMPLNKKTFLLGLILLSFNIIILASPDSKDLFAENGELVKVCFTCDNATDGGTIQGDEEDCPNPIFDPSLITNVSLPSGGSGNLEYIWIFTNDDPYGANSVWTPILNTNAPEYDPDPINITTHYRRCSRREGCVEYIAESNIVTKAVVCCDNVTDGGAICCDQEGCSPVFDPNTILNSIAPSGGSGNVEYLWYGSIVGSAFDPASPDWFEIPGSDSPNFDPGPLLQTTWYVRTSKRVGCTDYDGVSNMVQITLLEAPNLTSTISSPILCFGDTTGAIDLTITGALAPYQINWDNGIGNIEDPTDLASGTYTVMVSDSNNCSSELVVDLPEPDLLEITLSATNVSCNATDDGSASVAISGGTADYALEWNTNPTQNTDTISNLIPGIYAVKVVDANGCSVLDSIQVAQASDILLSTSSTAASCDGFANGSATVTIVSGGSPDFTYQWNDANAQTTATASNLSAGEYLVTVSDSEGCEVVDTVEVLNDVTLNIYLSNTEITCFGGSNGRINVDSITGGFGPYTWEWSLSGNDNAFSILNLTAGTYSITATDQNGCVVVDSLTLDDGYEIEVGLSTEDPSCLGLLDGTAKVAQITGGFPNYSYEWEPGFQVTDSISNLIPGTYSVTVTDGNGCTGLGTGEVGNGTPLTLNTSSVQETCLGSGDGTAAVVDVPGAILPLTYTWSTGGTDSLITGLLGGDYEILVQDAQGCLGLDTVEVESGGVMSLGIDKMDIQCGTDSNGTATVNVSGGSPGYTFIWNDPNTQMTQTASGLGIGNYTVFVTDQMGCTATDSVTIEASSIIMLSTSNSSVACFDGSDGSVSVNILNSNPSDYTIAWDTPHDSSLETVNGLEAGIYTVTVSDTLGCMGIAEAEVIAPDEMIIQLTKTDPLCHGSADGTTKITVFGGWAPYTYLWNTGETTTTLSNLDIGTYSIVVTDSLGCVDSTSIDLLNPDILTISFSFTNESCQGSADGSVNAIVYGGVLPYSFNWNDVNLPNQDNISNITAGDYALEVTDANGCISTDVANVGTNSTLDLSVFGNDISCHDENDGMAWVVASGGMGDYSFQWDDTLNSNTDTISNLSEDTYSVVVSDTAGCTVSGSVTIINPDTLVISTNTDDVYCANDLNGEIILDIQGGTAPFSALWSTGATSIDLSGVGPGVYIVTVTDARGCTGEATAKIGFTSDLSASSSSVPTSCFGGDDGIASVIPSGGEAPYTVSWSNGSNGNTVTNLTGGTHYATVTDAAGCEYVETVQISEADELFCSASVSKNISSYGGADGEATAEGQGGTAPYTYEWETDDLTQVAINLGAGEYFVTVTDANDCTCETSVIIENPSKLGNFVWEDTDEDGIQDNGEVGLADVKVIITGNTSSGMAFSDSTLTDASGAYYFDGLEAGFYSLKFELLATYMFSPKDEGSDNSLDSDVNQDGETTLFAINASTLYEDWDAGLIKLDEKINLGDYVWDDLNRNGVQDSSEVGVPNVTVRLVERPSGFVQASTTTNLFGFYEFMDVMPGDYAIEFVLTSLPTGYIFTEADQSTDEAIDSDPDPFTGFTPDFEVLPYTPDDLSYDAGIYPECDNVTSGGAIIGDEELCGLGADPAIIESSAPPSGGFGNLEYLWLQSNIPIYNGPGDPNWTVIPNSNSPTYDPGPISQDTYFIRCARREGCSDYIGETNIVSKIMVEYPLTNVEEYPNELCDNEGGKFVASIAGGGAAYFWEFGSDANPQTATTRTVNDVIWTTPGFKPVILTVTRFGCSYSTSVLVEILDCPSGNNLVAFGDLTAEVIDNKVALTWKAETNDKNAAYTIQRSELGVEFVTVGALEGQDSESLKTYDFMDEKPLMGESFYRIKRTKADSPIEFSELLKVIIEPQTASSLLVYPNPFNERLILKNMSSNEDDFEIEIINTFAQVVGSYTMSASIQKEELNLSHLPNGMYYVKVHQKNKIDYTVKVFKGD